MNSLWQALAELASSMHADRVEVVANAISRLACVEDFGRAKSTFGPSVDHARIERFWDAWKASPSITPEEVAAAFKAAAQATILMGSRGAVDLVWTGPRTQLIPTRQTEQVLLEVISTAKSDLFLVTYVFYKASSITTALNEAVGRGVGVSILLESSKEHGGTVRGDGVKAIRDAIPKSSIYVWDAASRKGHGDLASVAVHAKCAVADKTLAFITSANLTTAALERNMELGVLIRGGTVPDQLGRHLDALVTTKVIRLL